jgi:membrane protease YdiL (CAAX protease family)
LFQFAQLGQAASAEATSAPAASQPAPVSPALYGLLAVGVCILAVWVVRRSLSPQKLSLARTPGRPNTAHPLVLLGLFIVMQAVGFVASGIIRRWLPASDPKDLSAGALIASMLVAQVVFLPLALWVASKTFRLGLRRGLGLSARHWFYDSLRGIVAFLAVFPVCIFALMFVLRMFYANQPPPEHPMIEALHGAGTIERVLVVISVCVLAPLTEEVFFRGMVQSMLRHLLGNPWAAIAITAALFTVVHGTPAHWPSLLALAIVLGYNYERTGRLWASIMIHVLFNAVSVSEALMHA